MTPLDRASCQSCGEITIDVGDRRCAYCDGELRRIDIAGTGRRPGRRDNNVSRWNDTRRTQVIDAYGQGHDIPEIAVAIFEAMGYKNPATARAAIRQEFKRMNVGLRSPRKCERCERDALTGSKFCFGHAPERAQERLEIGKTMRAAQGCWPRRGEDHHLAKVWDEEIETIRRSDEPVEVLAQRFSLSTGHVRRIRSGAAWKHLEVA